jgi:hypothetical protein
MRVPAEAGEVEIQPARPCWTITIRPGRPRLGPQPTLPVAGVPRRLIAHAVAERQWLVRTIPAAASTASVAAANVHQKKHCLLAHGRELEVESLAL